MANRKDDRILGKVFAMDDEQFQTFISSLDVDALSYLEVLLTKTQRKFEGE